ncbi:unnamed protein product [Mesocestoides corti]|uniref:RNA 3'-terminal phosphate cyclase-like protein n=2 Tax=Mesocestoides corti TaxID=53468 RepID=A0A0R3U3U5_MESCO|nr:unnamed protein product [Mesocestoides corti]
MRPLIYEDGSSAFRQKILLSVITNQAIRVKNIRSRSKNPGVTASEVDFLKLINAISNGAVVKINDTGCIVSFSPGTLVGGEVDFNCSPERGLGYYLEPLILLCSFTKLPMSLVLKGVTNNTIDPSVDVLIQSWLPFLKRLLPPASASALNIEIRQRGLPPKGGGKILFTSKPAHFLSPIQLLTPGKVYRIRGVAWTCRVSPNVAPQLVHGAKELLNSFLSDVYINLDQRKREVAGDSSGFGLVLWAVTKEGIIYTAEACHTAGDDAKSPVVPSELGLKAASRLLDQIYLGGCVDQALQSAALSLMAFEGGHNASQLLISAPTPYTVQTLRLLQKVLGVTFDLTYADHYKAKKEEEETDGDEEEEEEEIRDGLKSSTDAENGDSSALQPPTPLVATCFGSGLKNLNLAIR